MKRTIDFAIIGGAVGFGFHLVWHYSTGTELFTFAPHNIQGTLFTIIGVIVGILISYSLRKS